MTTELVDVGIARLPRDVRLVLAREQHRALRAAVRIDALSAVGGHAHRRLAGVIASERAYRQMLPEASEEFALISRMAAEGIAAAVAHLAVEEL